MISAIVDYEREDVFEEKIQKLVEVTDQESHKLLRVLTSPVDHKHAHKYFESSLKYSYVDTPYTRLYITGSVRIQLEKVEYYM